MKRYYLTNPNSEKCFDEVTETEWLAVIGDSNIQEYASKLYRGEISIDEVPEDLQEATQTVVNNKIALWGKYEDKDISTESALDIITGGDGI